MQYFDLRGRVSYPLVMHYEHILENGKLVLKSEGWKYFLIKEFFLLKVEVKIFQKRHCVSYPLMFQFLFYDIL